MSYDISLNPAGRRFTPYCALNISSEQPMRGLGGCVDTFPPVMMEEGVYLKRGSRIEYFGREIRIGFWR
jgi:hypothetical protein